MIETVIFDVGNVLLDWNPRYLFRKLLPSEAEVERFLTTVCTSAWNLEQDRGRAWKDAVAEASARHPHEAHLVRAYDERWHETIGGAFEDSVTVVTDLATANVSLYALTNFSSEKFAETRTRYTFFDLFKGIVVSGEEKLIKPDPAIYRILFDRYGIEPDRAVFIDDSEANVAAANALGIVGLHFQTVCKLRQQLHDLGLPVTPNTATSV